MALPVVPNDVIRCEVVDINSCNDAVTISSNSITIQPNPGYNQGPEVTIATDKEHVCAGKNVTYGNTLWSVH